MASEAQATASLQLMLSGINEVLAGLDKLEAKLLSIKGLSGSVTIGGIGGSGGGNGNVSGVGTSSVNTSRGGALFGDTAGPASISTQWNPPSAQADMNVLGLSAAGNSAGMSSAVGAQNAAISAAPMFANMNGGAPIPGTIFNPYQGYSYQPYSAPQLALPGPGQSSFNAMNSVPSSGPYGPAMYNPYSFTGGPTNPGIPMGIPNANGYASPIGPLPMYTANGQAWGGASQGYSAPIGPGLGGTPGVAGGPFFSGQWWNKPMWGGSVNAGPDQDPNQSMMSLIALHYTLRQFETAGAESQGLWAQHIAGGKPLYDEQFIPSQGQMGLAMAGMAIGARYGQPIIGAAAGTYIGQSLSVIQPYIDRDVMQTQVSQYYGNAGLGDVPNLPENQLKFAMSNMLSGTPISARDLGKFQTHVNPMSSNQALSVELASDVLGGLAGAAVGFGTKNIAWGITAGMGAREAARSYMDSSYADNNIVKGLLIDSATDEQKQQVIRLLTNPYVEQQIGTFGSYTLDKEHLARAIAAGVGVDPTAAMNASSVMDRSYQPETGDGGAGLNGAKAERALGARRQINAQFGENEPFLDVDRSIARSTSSRAVSDYYTSGAGGQEIRILERQAQLQLSPAERAQNEASQKALMFQGATDLFGMRLNEIKAFGAENIQSASQELQGYLLSGGDPTQVSTADVQSSMMSQANSLIEQANNPRNPISDAERAARRVEAKDVIFNSQFNVPRALETEQITSMQSGLAAYQSYGLGRAQYQSIAGAASGQGQYSLAQAQSLREQADLNQKILDTVQYRTMAEKNNLELMVSQETSQARILQYTGQIANAQGSYNMAITGNLETSTAANIALISGVGGSQAGAALASMYSAKNLDVRAAQTLLNSFPDKNSGEALSARQALANAQTSAMQAREAQSNVPYNGFVQAERYQLEGSMSAIEAGLTPAGPGMIRQNLSRQMSITRSHIADIDQAASKLSQAEGGQLDPAQAQEFARQRSQAVSELSGLAKEFNYGYMDRLISMAYNMPQESSWYLRSQASNREASQYGVIHPSIGGTKAQLEQMASLGYDLRSIASAPGAGSPAGFNQATIGGATGGVRLPVITVPIQITDAKSGNVLAQNQVQFENGKQVNAFQNRTPLASRPAA